MSRYKQILKEKEDMLKPVSSKYLFPIFGNKQLKETLFKYNVGEDDLLHYGGGMYLLKSNRDSFREAYNEASDKIDKLMQSILDDDDLFCEAVEYEMFDYEYYYSFNDEDVLGSLNLTERELDNDSRLLALYDKARKQYFKYCNENY